MRFIAIGDIHGCISEFRELVHLLNIQPGDRVVCLGDFMDRGPDPVGCVRFAREQGFESVLGNHEEKHLKWRRNEARALVDPKYKNGMKPMPESELAENAALSDDDLAWLKSLPTILQPLPGYVVVHGGLFPGTSLEDQDQEKILRLRYLTLEGKSISRDHDSNTPVPPDGHHWTSLYDGPNNVVYGHEPHALTEPRVCHRPNGTTCYGIDTGCPFGGCLTALVVDGSDISFVQVPARQVYKTPPWPIPATVQD